ncbi:hypothetical protein [Mesorhizobium sp. CN2-181]|uniref:hypothetical protein n=1 Tax=Mesorhizobium yinganensis TaxID=3157707 RepID=UPI0032B7F81E
MAKKTVTREELLAQLEAFDNSTEVASLKAEVAHLKQENASFVSQRTDLERQLKLAQDAMQLVRDAVHKVDIRNRPLSFEFTEAGERASRMSMAEVQRGIQHGTNDPATGLPYTAETKPQRDLGAGTPKVTQEELERLFPQLRGPEVAGVEA